MPFGLTSKLPQIHEDQQATNITEKQQKENTFAEILEGTICTVDSLAVRWTEEHGKKPRDKGRYYCLFVFLCPIYFVFFLNFSGYRCD